MTISSLPAMAFSPSPAIPTPASTSTPSLSNRSLTLSLSRKGHNQGRCYGLNISRKSLRTVLKIMGHATRATETSKWFQPGDFTVKTSEVSTNGSPPMRIASPNEGGNFPLLVLLPGFGISNNDYLQLMERIASHGFVVVAPQLYTLFDAGWLVALSFPDATDEIKFASALIDWLPTGLSLHLPAGVRPDLANVALAGHSRGGKVAFAVALYRYATAASPRISALIVIDPVDGIKPMVLTQKPNSLNLGGTPVFVIGFALGEDKGGLLCKSSIPDNCNHWKFFSECQGPAYHWVSPEYGHVDMLNDKVSWVALVASLILHSSAAKELVGEGAIVAVLNGLLGWLAFLNGRLGWLASDFHRSEPKAKVAGAILAFLNRDEKALSPLPAIPKPADPKAEELA